MMKKLKVCFIGLGSIAKRHIRNLITIYDENIEIDVIKRKDSGMADGEVSKYISKVYYSIDESSEKYDAIFITNPTKLHYETIVQCSDYTRNFFY